jgi:uncharacterized membrane protein YidH (DUF202 family)
MKMKNSQNSTIERLRAAGLFTKGVVYGLVGILTAMFAIGMGGDIKGVSGIADFFRKQPGGFVLLALTALGLTAYALWRLYETFSNSDAIFQEDEKKTGKRLRYFYSAAVYGLLAYTFAKPLFGGGSGSGGDSKQDALGMLLQQSWGVYVIGAIALIVIGQAIYQFYRAYSGKFMKKLDEHPGQHYKNIKRAGKIGYTSRGVVFALIAFFLYRVINMHSAEAFEGTKGAMQYLLKFEYGHILLAAVAIGLIGYGVFNMMVARYTKYATLG